MRIELRLSFFFFFVLLASSVAIAADDDQAYCSYVNEQAAAERDRLRTPNAVVGFTQPSSALPMQLEFGLSASLANLRKGSLTMEIARRNCELYKATAEARTRVQYALPALQREILQHRLELLNQAFTQLDQLINADMKKVEAQNLTRPALYALQAARLRLSSDRATTATEISSNYIPPLSPAPIRDLIASKLELDRRTQESVAQLDRQNDWDVSFTSGGHHELTPWNQGSLGAYGVLSLSYNLAHPAIGQHLDKATDAYYRWKKVQQDDIANLAELLRLEVGEMIQVQQGQLEILGGEDRRLDDELARLASLDTNAATSYRSQLTADQIVLRVDLGDIRFRLETLRDFLQQNF